MEGVLLGLFLGAALTFAGYTLYTLKIKKNKASYQASVLLEQVKRVCKLVSVEGEFAEIFHYEKERDHFMRFFSSKKKALIVINAKAQVGYDLNKVRIQADEKRKRIILSSFPQPEVLSIEPELEFYDIKNGLFNAFTPDDLTELNKEAKSHVREKIPNSGLMEIAKKEALDSVLLMEKIAETIGWKLDYEALKLDGGNPQIAP